MSNSSNNLPQVSLLLRLLGGGYLVYLAWDLRSAFSDGLIFIFAAAAFALVGGALLVHSIWKLARHEYFRKEPIQETESTEDWEESTNE
ncbi:MAG: hypothetical protein ACI3V0_11845 [Faecousia sp.]